MIECIDVSAGFVTVSFTDRDERLFKQLRKLRDSHFPELRDRGLWVLLKGEIAEWVLEDFKEIPEETMMYEVLKVDYDRGRDIWTDGAIVCLDVKGSLYFTMVSVNEKLRIELEPLKDNPDV